MHTDNTTSNGARRIVALLLVAAAVGTAAFAGTPGPRWLPGFPLRAGTSVILMWSPVPEATAYRLLKQTPDGKYKEIYRGPGNSFNDQYAPPSVTVQYMVVAVVRGSDSEPSPVATLRGIEVLKPPAVTGAITTAEQVTLRWSSPPGTVYSNVYRAPAEDGPYVLLDSVPQETYSDRKVQKGKDYYYKLTAVDKTNRESGKSRSVKASIREPARAAPAEKDVFKSMLPRGEFKGEPFYELNQPSEIEATADGDLHVLERRSIQFFDRDGVFLRRINFPGGWGLASGAVTDRDGGILLAFHGDRVVRKIEPDGKLAAEIRYPPFREKIPINPNHVAVDPDGYYWILDGVNASLVKTDRHGAPVAVIGRRPDTYELRNVLETELPAAKKVYLNPHDGRLYVLLGVSAEIRVFDPKTLSAVKTFGGLGASNARFQAVGGLAFRKNGNILVLDPLLQVIKEFDKEYEYVATYVNPAEKDKPKLSANLATAFAFREDIGRVYVTSTLGHRVYKFDVPD